MKNTRKLNKTLRQMKLSICFGLMVGLLQAQEGNTDNNYNGTESNPCIQPSTSWYLGGNNIAPQLQANSGSNSPNVAPNYTIYSDIGTCNNYDFVLKSNNNLTMWLKPSTKVGISEANPKAKFEVLELNPLMFGREGEGFSKLLLTSIRANV